MYLSCAELDLTQRSVLRVVSSPYRMHAVIAASLGDAPSSEDGRWRQLWRIDDTTDPGMARLYVVSPEPPDRRELLDRLGPEGVVSLESKPYGPFVERISAGSTWAFRLKANPTRKVKVDKGSMPREEVIGTIQGHVTVDQQIAWLVDHSASNGFELVGGTEGVLVSHRKREVFDRQGEKVTLVTAQYDGVLRVTDAESFKRALGFGIGRAKGFGCGLLTVVPVQCQS